MIPSWAWHRPPMAWLLAGGLRRRRLRLRRRPVLRFGRGDPLNEPIVGMAATADGRGYWLVASDGGVFAYGDAQFSGSAGATHLNEPIVGMAPTADGDGYWLVASDGGVFAYGDAPVLRFRGATPPQQADRGHGPDRRWQGLLAGGLRRRHLRLWRRRSSTGPKEARPSTSRSWGWPACRSADRALTLRFSLWW